MKSYDEVIHNGKNIVIVDLSNTTPEQAIVIMREAQEKIAQMPPHSVLILTDVTNARYNAESLDAIKGFAAKNSPFIKASAAVGSEGLRAVVRPGVERAAGRKITAFATREEAMDWLASQE